MLQQPSEASLKTEHNTCWYCQATQATSETAYVKRLYQVGPTKQMEHTDLPVPRCASCRHRHIDHETWSGVLSVGWGLLSLFGGMGGVIYFELKEKGGAVGVIVYTVVLLAIVLGGLYLIIEFAQKHLLKNIRPENEIKNYPPLEDLKAQGWCVNEFDARAAPRMSPPVVAAPVASIDGARSAPTSEARPIPGSEDVMVQLDELFVKTKKQWLKLDQPVQGEVMAVLVMTQAFQFLRDEVGTPLNTILRSAQSRWPDRQDLNALRPLDLGPPANFDVHDIPRVSEQFKAAIGRIMELKKLLSA